LRDKPFVWQMVKDAIDNLGSVASYGEIKKYIKDKYGDVNDNTITAQIITCTVNHNSRIHYSDNNKPRIADSKYDFLFTTGKGQVELYDPKKHGIWEIVEDDYGKLIVKQFEEPKEEGRVKEKEIIFPLESHLRDFIARNIESISINDEKIMLYNDEFGNDGVEYPTEVGSIDILAVNEMGDFIVFELKLLKGPDKAVGQILRYMGWIKENLAREKNVKGVIVSKMATDKLKYAASMVPEISLFEYELSFEIKEAGLEKSYNELID
jgi:endonuclease